ncbi:MAG: hypothetical protein JSR60_18335 [Proteobacteria bacterium]|nr:hypothetical protein [Pseudomonadota bacterium]
MMLTDSANRGGDIAAMELRSFLATFVAGVFTVICAFYIATRGPLASGAGWTPEGLVTVVLTAATVVLAGLGIAVALVAIWGYDRIKEAAIKGATSEAVRIATAEAVKEAKAIAEVTAAREVAARYQNENGNTSTEIIDAFAQKEGGE